LTTLLGFVNLTLSDALPSTVEIKNVSGTSFTGEIQGQGADCTVIGNTFSCDPMSLNEPFEFAIGSATVEFNLGFSVSLSGTMQDPDNMSALMTADIATCSDTDNISCALLSTLGGVSLPCTVSLTGDASL
jgi:hypothetical protein